MSWVLWDIITPLLLTFALGLLTGWLLWRWRRQRVTTGSETAVATNSAEVTDEGSDSADSLIANSAEKMESINAVLIAERDEAVERANAAESSLSEAQVEILKLKTELPDTEGESAAAVEALAVEGGVSDEDIDKSEKFQNLVTLLAKEQEQRAAIELELTEATERHDIMERELGKARETAIAVDADKLASLQEDLDLSQKVIEEKEQQHTNSILEMEQQIGERDERITELEAAIAEAEAAKISEASEEADAAEETDAPEEVDAAEDSDAERNEFAQRSGENESNASSEKGASVALAESKSGSAISADSARKSEALISQATAAEIAVALAEEFDIDAEKEVPPVIAAVPDSSNDDEGSSVVDAKAPLSVSGIAANEDSAQQVEMADVAVAESATDAEPRAMADSAEAADELSSADDGSAGVEFGKEESSDDTDSEDPDDVIEAVIDGPADQHILGEADSDADDSSQVDTGFEADDKSQVDTGSEADGSSQVDNGSEVDDGSEAGNSSEADDISDDEGVPEGEDSTVGEIDSVADEVLASGETAEASGNITSDDDGPVSSSVANHAESDVTDYSIDPIDDKNENVEVAVEDAMEDVRKAGDASAVSTDEHRRQGSATNEPAGHESVDSAKTEQQKTNTKAKAKSSSKPKEQTVADKPNKRKKAVVKKKSAKKKKTNANGYSPSAWEVPSRVPSEKNRDRLTDIKGVGPVLEGILHDTGIYYFKQVALLDKDGVRELQEQIPQFPGRIKRDKWVSQAKSLHRKKYGVAAKNS